MQKDKICITMPHDVVERLEALSNYTRLSKSVLLTKLVDMYYANVKKEIEKGGKAGTRDI